MKNNGSVLILFIPVTLAILALISFLVRWGHGLWLVEKASVTAEATLISSLRIKAEGLQNLAKRWNELRPFLKHASSDQIEVRSEDWPGVIALAQELKKSVPGYKGRIKAVIKVVGEANGVARENIQTANEKALELEVVSQGQWIADLSGQRIWVEGLWLSRAWDLQNRLGQPSASVTQEVVLRDKIFGPLKTDASARLGWDVDLENSAIRTHGNGGYPRNWNEAKEGSVVNPFRWAVFRVERVTGGDDVHQE